METYLRTGDGSWLYQAIDGIQSSVRIAGLDLSMNEFTADPGA